MTDNTNAHSHLEQAYVCQENKNFQDALKKCELALQHDPALADAYNLKGIIR